MKMKRLTVAVVTGALVAAGAGAAIGATSGDGKKAEDAILSDAAKRLDVTPLRLRDALGAAEDAQLDQAVKDGKLTQAQADEIKQRAAQSGRVLGIGPGGRGGRHGHGGPGFGRGPGGGLFDDAAGTLGLTAAELRTQLQAGKTLAEIAKAQKKDLADVKAAMKAAVTKRLDAAVKAGQITDAIRDHELAEFDEHFDALSTGKGPGGRGPRHRGDGTP